MYEYESWSSRECLDDGYEFYCNCMTNCTKTSWNAIPAKLREDKPNYDGSEAVRGYRPEMCMADDTQLRLAMTDPEGGKLFTELRELETVKKYDTCNNIWIGCDIECRDCLRWVFAEPLELQPLEGCLPTSDFKICREEAKKLKHNLGCNFAPECEKTCPSKVSVKYRSSMEWKPTTTPAPIASYYHQRMGQKIDSNFTGIDILVYCAMIIAGLYVLYASPLILNYTYKYLLYFLGKLVPPAAAEEKEPDAARQRWNGARIVGGKTLVVGFQSPAPAAGRRLRVGDSVALVDQGPGDDVCLKKGELGRIVKDDHDAQPYQVLGAVSGEHGWYAEEQLTRVDAREHGFDDVEAGTLSRHHSQATGEKDAWRNEQTADALIRCKEAQTTFMETSYNLACVDTCPSPYVLKLDRFDVIEVQGKAKELRGPLPHAPPGANARRPVTSAALAGMADASPRSAATATSPESPRSPKSPQSPRSPRSPKSPEPP